MLSKLKYFLFLAGGLICGITPAQNLKIDSLRKLVATYNADTNKVITLNALADQYLNLADYPKVDSLCRIAIVLSKKINYELGLANAYNKLASSYYYEDREDTVTDIYLEALRISNKLKYYPGIATAYIGIGEVYEDIQEYDEARAKFDTALTFADKVHDSTDIASALQDIGNLFEEQKDYSSALNYHNKAVSLFLSQEDTADAAMAINDIGFIYLDIKNYPLALQNLNKAIMLGRQDSDLLSTALTGMGYVYYLQGDYYKALKFCNTSYEISQERKQINDLINVDSTLSKVYEKTGNIALSFKYFKDYVLLNEKIFGGKNQNKILKSNLKYITELKQVAAKAEQDKKELIAEQDKRREDIIRNSFIVGFALTLALAFFIFRNYLQKRRDNIVILKQKDEVERQKNLIEEQKSKVEQKNVEIQEKNKDILDSITYAKRLQDAILPPLNLIKQYLPESFVLYKPKDIVAGDFYWLERVNDTILIAACDCTGHGVPGAMVSVVCSNALNRAVKEFKLYSTGPVLTKVRELVLETFEKSEGEVKDGMDCSFCTINTKSREIEWSGAYNPLWYVVNGEIKELAPDKQPIGKTDSPKPFGTQSLNLPTGSMLYLFSDGYADQFGGPKGKKYKYKQLQELLLANASKPMNEQKALLEEALNEWKGSLEQVDDILVIGIRT